MTYKYLTDLVKRLTEAGMNTDKAVHLVAETYHADWKLLQIYVKGE